MTAGGVLLLSYWILFTIRSGFTPHYAKAYKANEFDRKSVRKAAEALHYLLLAAKWALQVIRWLEFILLFVLVIWGVYLIGAIITGSFILLGYPV